MGLAMGCLGFEGDLDTQCWFYKVGFDSLGVQEFKQTPESDIGVELSNTMAFDYQNLQTIAKHISEDILSEALDNFAASSKEAAMPEAVALVAVAASLKSAMNTGRAALAQRAVF